MIRVDRHYLNRERQLFSKRNLRNRTRTEGTFSGFGLFFVRDICASSIACKSMQGWLLERKVYNPLENEAWQGQDILRVDIIKSWKGFLRLFKDTVIFYFQYKTDRWFSGFWIIYIYRKMQNLESLTGKGLNCKDTWIWSAKENQGNSS